MKLWIQWIVFGLTLALAPVRAQGPDNTLTERERNEGWRLLFDGKSLDGWMNSDRSTPRTPVENGALNPHGAGHYMLVHTQEWANFVLSLDFKISARCNSGIFLRTNPLTPRPGKDVGYNGLEVAIDDTHEAGFVDTGALYDLSKPSRNAMKPVGEWNHIEITCDGPRIRIVLNGDAVNTIDLSQFTQPNKRPDGSTHKFDVIYRDHPGRGYIGLQDHGSPCWYKNIKLKPLDFAPIQRSLTDAVVLTPKELSKQERKAVQMLVEEAEKRSQVRWTVTTELPKDLRPVIAVGRREALNAIASLGLNLPSAPAPAGGPEGFQVAQQHRGSRPLTVIAGNDARGVLFGVGYLLRHLHFTRGAARLDESLQTASAPKYPLRGHQLGYRPKTHSYDAWDLAVWEQYYRDLIIFGINAVELIPPRSDDDDDSPHFPLPPLQMMRGMSQLADDYGLDVWVWYPAMDKDYADPATVEFALKEWAEVFKALPRIDVIYVPGGDPGHTRPVHLMKLLEKQTQSLHTFHPKAQMWVSPQSFNKEWLDEFLGILKTQSPDWLGGIVFGPQVRVSLPELRASVPTRYPIRHYPDITHTRQCQYPVPDWDTAFALTEGRECINPRPVDQAAIFRLLQPYTMGFITYSEGCNDDVNKAIWSALGWDPDRPVAEVLREFSRYFIGEAFTDSFAQGLLALEQNWRGPLIANAGIQTTLEQFRSLERQASPAVKANWRFQQALFRAYYDAYLRARAIHETALEEEAMTHLRNAETLGSRHALALAEAALNRALTEPAARDLRARVFELAEALFQSIRMQLSVPRYQAIGVDRGASLDTIDYPLNNRRWLREHFERIRLEKSESARLVEIDKIARWTDPGPGGFYDDTGNIARQPHVVRGKPFAEDPASLVSSKVGFEEGDVVDEPDEKPEGAMRYSWFDHAESLLEQPLTMRWPHLDPSAHYKVRVMYVGDAPKRLIRLVANGGLEIHPLIKKEFPYKPVEFDIPAEATRTGTLELSWYREAGLGGNGRGCQVSEVWLIRNQSKTSH